VPEHLLRKQTAFLRTVLDWNTGEPNASSSSTRIEHALASGRILPL